MSEDINLSKEPAQEDEIKTIKERLNHMGIKVHHKWGLTRLRAELKKALGTEEEDEHGLTEQETEKLQEQLLSVQMIR